MYIGFACMALYLYNIYYYPCRSQQKKLRICLLLTRVRRALPTLQYRSWSLLRSSSSATAPSSAAPTCATAGPCSACPRSAAGPSSAAPTCATAGPCSAGSSSATAPLASAPPLPPAPPAPLLAPAPLAHALLAPAPPLAPALLLPPAPPLAPAPWGIWPHPYWGPPGARPYRRRRGRGRGGLHLVSKNTYIYYKFIITTNVF